MKLERIEYTYIVNSTRWTAVFKPDPTDGYSVAVYAGSSFIRDWGPMKRLTPSQSLAHKLLMLARKWYQEDEDAREAARQAGAPDWYLVGRKRDDE